MDFTPGRKKSRTVVIQTWLLLVILGIRGWVVVVLAAFCASSVASSTATRNTTFADYFYVCSLTQPQPQPTAPHKPHSEGTRAASSSSSLSRVGIDTMPTET